MKKILSIAVAMIMLLAFAVPVLAADTAEVDYVQSVTYTDITTDIEAGYHVEIRSASPNEVNEVTLKAAAAKAVPAAEISGYQVVDIVVVDDATDAVIEWPHELTVAFTYDNASQVVAVLVQNDDQSWSTVPFEKVGDSLSLELPHLSPVSLVLKVSGVEPVPGGSDNQGSNSGSNQGGNSKAGSANTAGVKTSPQTGYNTGLWTVLAAAMVLCAGFCFVSARKKVSE